MTENVSTPQAGGAEYLPKKGIVLAGTIGSFVDWYIFFITLSAAAIVFPKIFFPSSFSPAAALVISAATVGIAYGARIVGAAIFGRWADKIGRKAILYATLIFGVVSAVGIGLIPNYSTVGYWALALLIIFRLVYGIGLGGEYGASTIWLGEHANKSKYRTLWITLPANMTLVGTGAAVITFAILEQFTTTAFFFSYGWRIAFYLAGAMAGFGILIRYFYTETPIFQKLLESKKVKKEPLGPLFRDHWKQIFTFAFTFFAAIAVISVIIIPYAQDMMGVAATHNGVPNYMVSYIIAIGIWLSAIPSTLLFKVSDRIGRVNTLLISAVWTLVFAFPFVYIMTHTYSLLIMGIATYLMFQGSTISNSGITPMLAEYYDTRYRSSGTGITYNMAAMYSGLLVGYIEPQVVLRMGGYLTAGYGIASMVVVIGVIAIVACFVAKKTLSKVTNRDLSKDLIEEVAA